MESSTLPGSAISTKSHKVTVKKWHKSYTNDSDYYDKQAVLSMPV